MLCIAAHNNIHHLPVIQRAKGRCADQPDDIIRFESQSRPYLVSNIFNKQDVAGAAGAVAVIYAATFRAHGQRFEATQH